jgi:hypothetical protein
LVHRFLKDPSWLKNAWLKEALGLIRHHWLATLLASSSHDERPMIQLPYALFMTGIAAYTSKSKTKHTPFIFISTWLMGPESQQ